MRSVKAVEAIVLYFVTELMIYNYFCDGDIKRVLVGGLDGDENGREVGLLEGIRK